MSRGYVELPKTSPHGQASLTFAKSNNKKTKPKSVIQKYNKASEVCRDIATFLSTCGQTEFEEKLMVLTNLKTEWQCSQITHNPLTEDSIKPQPSIPVLANEALATNFNLESISNGQVNDIMVSEELPSITNEQILNASESNHITAEPTETTESTEPATKSFNIFDELCDVHINNVKCRRGRPKGSKKPFWSFSNSKTKSGKKRKANDVLPNPSKVPKCQNKEQNAESPNKSNDKPNHTKIVESKEQPKTQIQSRKTIPACSMEKTKPNSIKEDKILNDKGNQMKDTDPDKLWLKIYNISLQQKDKNTIINKHMLNDKVIDAAQTIMKKQFNDSPKINGFQSVIFKQNTKH